MGRCYLIVSAAGRRLGDFFRIVASRAMSAQALSIENARCKAMERFLRIDADGLLSILIADDEPIVRLGIKSLARELVPSAIFHEAVSDRAAIDIAGAERPSLALVDMGLSGPPRFDFIKRLREAAPGMPILVFSAHDERLYAERALRAGAKGYAMKSSSAERVGAAISAVLGGRVWLSEELREELVNRIARSAESPGLGDEASLTDRELTVFRLIGQGLKKGAIARSLNLSPNTIETYRSHIKRKLGVATGAELSRLAYLRSKES